MFGIILKDIASFLDLYFIRSMIAGVVCAVIYMAVCLLLRKKGYYTATNRHIYIKSTVFFFGVIYSYMVLGITFLCREAIFEKRISFVPFNFHTGNARLIAYDIENIIMFIPYGFIIPILLGKLKKWYWCLLVGLVSSLTIETLQYTTQRGQAQLADVILNTLGMMIGWFLLLLVIRIYKKERKNNV